MGRNELTNLVVVTGYLVWAEAKEHAGVSQKVQGLLCLPGKKDYRDEFIPVAAYGSKANGLLEAKQASVEKPEPGERSIIDPIVAEGGALLTIEGRLASAGPGQGSYLLVDRIRFLDDGEEEP